ncbi:MAG: endonuclease [bacterium]|nr:endonuclease [bacterium]
MKKPVARFCTFLLLLMALVPAARADVIISELCDPRLNYLTDRYIEIYNSGASSVSLTGWQLVAVGNGADIFTWNLSGTIAPGEALVAGGTAPVVAFPIDFAAAAWATSNATWNGNVNDGAKLRNGSGTVVESLVVPSTNFENKTMVRNADVSTPSLTFNAAQWTSTAVDTPTQATPGVHNPVVSQGPVISAVTTNPAGPLPGQTVSVQATVTDANATITTVTLNWGLVSGSLTNAIPMSDIGGGTWVTAASLPAQSAGATVYYAVTAANSIPAQTVSPQQSYALPTVVAVAAIQGAGAASTYIGQTVVTSGVVTAGFGTTFTIQDGAGARSGLWVSGVAAPATGTLVEVRGVVAETNGNTMLTTAQVNSYAPGVLPTAAVLTTGEAIAEDWEGVLVQVVDASCTLSAAATPRWEVTNSGGAIAVDDLAVSPNLVQGTRYTITGPVSGNSTADGVVPRSAADIVFVGDTYVPLIVAVVPAGTTSLQVKFSEPVAAATANVAGNYLVSGCTVLGAALVSGQPETVALTLTVMGTGSHTLTVGGVADLYGNVVSGAQVVFSYYGGNIPAGYYASAEGLVGATLQAALESIIDGHQSVSYDGLWTAFYTTDDKPNGKVWDMYSDIPGGIPPYEYTFGVDQGGTAGSEGSGYNREHSWPASWYGSTSPMYTDLFMVYPTDNDVNNLRGNYPFGEVGVPTETTLNGSKLGPCAYPGYSGTVFEPIDAYKGDFARAYFYMTTRYYLQDGSWPGSPMTDGAVLLPWAEAMLLEWNTADPVSTKEIDRNEAVYAIQGNRNPFIDRPDFVQKVFQPELSPVPQPVLSEAVVLHQNVPNPFNPSTVIRYELTSPVEVELQVYDLAGHLVDTIFAGPESAGRHEATWQGRDEAGRSVATGVYFYRLRAGSEVQTRRMVLSK